MNDVVPLKSAAGVNRTFLTLYLLMTAVVGYALQHKLGSHVLPSDALLLTGLLRGAVVRPGLLFPGRFRDFGNPSTGSGAFA